ncbi:haloacid dehalogenase-like hydrolase [uncultured Clostridium sp.]|jgi:phosphoserine phosphatase|uniref:HAD family hydrolase n=1 Tax=uncultured Clostridium sp. TaxID=59620 RepID=UPI00260FA802|nr:haloacid dehalogenase-like hydrolase [uncultured Clostridium sp.]
MDKILAVDLCNTLYKSNTTQDFFSYVFAKDDVYKKLKRKNSNFGFKVVNKLSNKIFKYDMSRALITKILKGKSSKEIDNLVDGFIDDFLEERKISEVHKIITEYKENSYKVVIISASYGFIAKRIVERLGINAYISSEAEVLDGIYTGRVSKDILYTKFNEFSSLYATYEDLVMITDNITDYEFVKKTKNSYIVINKENKAFWSGKKEEKFIFVEE